MVEVQLKIYGRVQGVFFRSETQKKAQQLNLKGWVRNEPDGTVFAVVQGDNDQIQQLLEWCKEGPDAAKVENIDIMPNPNPSEQYRDFSIKY